MNVYGESRHALLLFEFMYEQEEDERQGETTVEKCRKNL